MRGFVCCWRCRITVLEPITPENALIYKAVRLRALQDSPSAFGSTHAKESKLSDEDWIQRTRNWNGDKSIVYLAMDAGEPCGLAGGFLEEQDPDKIHLVSMWIAPTHRRRGLGHTLINAIRSWAISRNAHTLQLMVTSNNHAAIEFYKHIGFSMTGRTEPYPNDPALIEFEMAQSLR